MFFSPMIKELQEDVPKTVDLVNKMVNQSKNKYVLQYTVEIFLYIKLRKKNSCKKWLFTMTLIW